MNVGDVTGPRWVSGGVDEVLRALGESRQRFADSETKRAELEAVIQKVRDVAELYEYGGGDYYSGRDSIRAELVGLVEASPSVVLQDHDAAVWERGYKSGHSRAMRMMSDEPGVPNNPNPYRDAR